MQHLCPGIGKFGSFPIGDLAQNFGFGNQTGSAVMIPSTSLHIQSSRAPMAAAITDADKSEPPRPSVVGLPSAVAPLNPVTIGITR